MDSDSFLSQLAELFKSVEACPPDAEGVTALVLAVLFLALSAAVSASEIAFFSLSASDLEKLEEEKHPSDRRILRLKADSDRLFATMLVSNNVANVAVIMLLNFFFQQTLSFGGHDWLGFLLVTVVLIILILLFGDIMPKIYFAQHALGFCRAVSPLIVGLEKCFWPVASMLVRTRQLATKVVHKESRSISVDELEQALELTDKKDIAEEQNMLEGIIRFGGEMAKEIMTPRMDIVDLDIKTPYPDVLKCIVESNYSRIPVYADSRDNIKGILYIKDLLPHLNKPSSFRWQTLIRPPYFVPETKKIDDLLGDFQKNKVHIAIVVDEFGGTSGIVTMEDIIEEIVGEINDEYDDDERQYVRLNADTYVFEAKILLTDFVKVMQVDDDFFEEVEGEADTLAGLLLELKGEFPALHEVIRYKNYSFEVLEMDNRRILKIKVKVEPQEKPEDKDNS